MASSYRWYSQHLDGYWSSLAHRMQGTVATKSVNVFNLYINEIGENVNPNSADDCILHRPISSMRLAYTVAGSGFQKGRLHSNTCIVRPYLITGHSNFHNTLYNQLSGLHMYLLKSCCLHQYVQLSYQFPGVTA